MTNPGCILPIDSLDRLCMDGFMWLCQVSHQSVLYITNGAFSSRMKIQIPITQLFGIRSVKNFQPEPASAARVV